jgi:molybdate transport system substrate-binding protein
MKWPVLFVCASALLSAAASAQTALPLGEGSQRVADAKPGDARLLVTDGFRSPLEKVRADLEKTVGHKLVIEYSESHVLQREMESGQPFELALVTADVVDAETAKGVILPDHQVVARIRIGLFQRGDAPVVDLSTPEALKKALLGAKSISWSVGSAAEPSALNVVGKLGISDTIKAQLHKTVMGHPAPPVALGTGEYELRFNAINEAPGPLPLAGEIPRTLEVPAVIPAGIGAHGDVTLAHAIVKYLMSPAFTPVLNSSKMMR